ncbi:MAG: LytTR family transcriptional regulator DNA-binding domain-containing protein [Bilifractor sp.]|jgi:hypothetical protein
MKRQELIQQSIYIVTEYYKNNLEPFFACLAEDVLWIGPRKEQILRGRETMIRTWSSAEQQPTFSMGNITEYSVSTGTNNLEVMLEYDVHTYFRNGEVDRHHQRLHMSWGCRREENSEGIREPVPRVYMIHISNIIGDELPPGESVPGKDGSAFPRVYAGSASESHIDAACTGYSGLSFRSVIGKGDGIVTYFFNSATILWIESADDGRHSLIHALDGTYKSIEPLRYYEAGFSDALLRAHASYLVNPLYVRSLKRFEITMTDGAVLPVPEKKYTAFRNRLLNWKPEVSR